MKLYLARYRYLCFSLMLVFLLLPDLAVCAEGSQHKIIKLSDLMLVDEQIYLRNIEGYYHFDYALSRRETLQKVKLHLDFTHSTALLKERSQLVVSVNDVVVEQFILNPRKPHTISDIVIPTDYFITGYNKITLSVAQHYTLQCEIPESAELWTQVNSTKSYLAIDSVYNQQGFTLADLNHVFDKKLRDYKLTILQPKQAHYTNTHLYWGGLVAQGVALRLDYKAFDMVLGEPKTNSKQQRQQYSKNDPLRFLRQTRLNSDVVLMGTVDELARFIAPQLQDKITGAFIGLYPGQNKRTQVLLISGVTDAEVTQAATAFAYARNAFPDAQDMLVQSIQQPFYSELNKPDIMISGESYQFKQLGFYTRTMKYGDQRSKLVFNMPGDLYHELKSHVTLKLNYNYGAAFRADSVLNIRINNVFVKAISLDNKYGDNYQDYAVKIPSSSFAPGRNEISFEAVMPPFVSGDCILMQNKNSLVTIFDSSSIHFPRLDHYVRLPNLELLQRTGFPYLNDVTGAKLGIVLRDENAASIIAAWKLLAKLSQINQAPLPMVKLAFDDIKERHLFIIGARSALHASDVVRSPVQFIDNGMQFPFSAGKMAVEKSQVWFDFINHFLFPESIAPESVILQPLHAKLKFLATLGEQALMVSYPAASDQLLYTLITYDDAAAFLRNMDLLIAPEMWGRLEHNIVVWKDDKDSVEMLLGGEEFYLGETSIRHKLAYYFSLHKGYWLILVLLLLLLIALMAHYLLRRYKLKHHGDLPEYNS